MFSKADVVATWRLRISVRETHQNLRRDLRKEGSFAIFSSETYENGALLRVFHERPTQIGLLCHIFKRDLRKEGFLRVFHERPTQIGLLCHIFRRDIRKEGFLRVFHERPTQIGLLSWFSSELASYTADLVASWLVRHCNTLQHTATHCNTLQHTATHCNTLQHTATE